MPDRLSELRELTRAASPGPWADDDMRDRAIEPDLISGWDCARSTDETEFPGAHWLRGPHWVDCTDSGLFLRPADAALIVAMRNALPTLLDVAAAAREALQRIECLEDCEAKPPYEADACIGCAVRTRLSRALKRLDQTS